MRIAVFCSANDSAVAPYAREVRQLGTWMGQQGHTLVYGGSNTGLMECLAKAVHEAGGRVTGVVPTLLEKGGHVSDLIDVEIPCDNLSDRKSLMLAQADIAVVLPGGIGTLDELFTVAASHTIGYHHKPLLVYNIRGFWDSLVALLDDLQAKEMIRGSYTDCIQVVTTLGEIQQQVGALA